MNERRSWRRGLHLTGLLMTGGVFALLAGGSQTGCGSDNGNGGAGGGAAGTSGSAGTTGAGGTTGTAGGGGGSGGGSVACANDLVPIAANTEITTNTTWACNTYLLQGLVGIGNGATLTIEAGSTIYGAGDANSPAALIAKRDGRLVAVGTAERPIVFTSGVQPPERMPGDTLAGIVLLGKASINNGACQNDGDPSTPACDAPGFLQANIEGIAATDPRGQYGGTDDTHDCGELKYVRVEFAGFVIGEGNELNGITVGGCGSNTKLSYLQVHRGFDDGIEFFGGTASADHIVISGATDDSIDWDNGWRGKIQFLIVHQAYGKGDKAFESDNLGGNETAAPRSNPEIWNATLIAETGSAKVGMHLREGTRFKLRNFIVHGFGGGAVDIDAAQVMPSIEWPADISIESSVFFGGPLSRTETSTAPDGGSPTDNDMGFDEAAAIMDAARMNSTTADPMFASGLNGSVIPAHPVYVPGNAAAVNGKATPPAPLDTTATYAGAVAPGTDPTSAWYAGWTAFPEK